MLLKGRIHTLLTKKETLDKTRLWAREGRPFRPLKVFKSRITCSRVLSFPVPLVHDLTTSHPAVANRSREGSQTAAPLRSQIESRDELCQNHTVCLFPGGSKVEGPLPTSFPVCFRGGINCLAEAHLGNWGDRPRRTDQLNLTGRFALRRENACERVTLLSENSFDFVPCTLYLLQIIPLQLIPLLFVLHSG